MQRTVKLETRNIEYTLERKAVKKLNLRIKADRRIFVSASKSIPIKEIDAFIKKNSTCILQSIQRFSETARQKPSDKAFIDGETTPLFGKNLRLKVKRANRNSVECDESYITLSINDTCDIKRKKQLLESWLRKQCKSKIESICQRFYPQFKKYGISFPAIHLRKMISRWGSCVQSKNLLTFNSLLVTAPVSCIEYVVMHELIHLRYPFHTREFYRQLTIFMPDWKMRKSRLEAL